MEAAQLHSSTCFPVSNAIISSLSHSYGLRSSGQSVLFSASQGLGSKRFYVKENVSCFSVRLSGSSGSKRLLTGTRCAQEFDVSQPQENRPSQGLFGPEKSFSGTENFIRSFPTPIRYLIFASVIAGAAGAGYAIGGKVKVPAGEVAGAVALGVVGAGTAYVVESSKKEVAAKEIHNTLVQHSRPKDLQYDEVEAVANKFGVSLEDERFIAELKELYGSFVTGQIPPGSEPLQGDEVDSIIQFKKALGLEDDDAAAVHMEIGRRIFRQRLETGDKDTSGAERKTFQKLVYISQLVFGEKSNFLLPWKRVFKVTESQVDVALEDNSRRLLQAKLDESNAEPEAEKLAKLRSLQLKFRVADEKAEEMFRALARKRVEAHITNALEVLRSRTRIKDTKRMVNELESILAYNSALAAISQEPDLIPGVSPLTVAGGEYDGERAMGDLKQLYGAYLNEALTGGQLEQKKVDRLAQLRNVFGMGRREAEAVETEVTGRIYKRKLAQVVSSGELDAAPSKAAFLEDLCDSLRFDPEEAFALHEEIYKQKLEQCLQDNSLSDEDVKALLRLRVLLCIPQKTVDAAHAEICGRIFAKVVDDAISAGVDSYDADMQKAVQDAARGLRLPKQAALDIAAKAVKAVLITFTRRAKSAGSRVESGRELKKMVMFSNLTVSRLLDDIKRGTETTVVGETALSEEQKLTREDETKEDKFDEGDDEELEMLQSFRKTKGEVKEGKAQKEINLKDELELRDRTDLYEKFLLYAIQGETAGMPMGSSIVVQRDNSDFIRLGQLGDILGLTSAEVTSVHQGLAEKAFKTQAQTLLADGQLSKARAQQLKQLQQQLGLPDAAAQKVIQSITSTKMAGAIDQAVQQGRLTVEDIRELKASGVDIQTMVAKPVRIQLFRKLINKAFSSGSGQFNSEEVFKQIPEDLGLDAEAMRGMAIEVAKERLKDSLVQSVALLRQKKAGQVIAELNNLLACAQAVNQEAPLSWPVKEELLDLYGMFLAQPNQEEHQERLRNLLGIDENTASTLADEVQSGRFEDAREEDFVF